MGLAIKANSKVEKLMVMENGKHRNKYNKHLGLLIKQFDPLHKKTYK